MNSDTKAKSRLSFNQIAPVLIPNSKAPASPAPIEMEIEIEMPVSQPPNASEEETPMDEKVFTDDNARERSRFWLGIVEKFRADEKDGEAMKLAELMDSYDLTRRRLTALFRKMDEDNGGSISKDEFRQGLETLVTLKSSFLIIRRVGCHLGRGLQRDVLSRGHERRWGHRTRRVLPINAVHPDGDSDAKGGSVRMDR